MAARVLIVEDDAVLAFNLADMLAEVGFTIIGPAASVAQARALLSNQTCDAAILDIHLGRDETSEPIAQDLTAAGTPFLTLTGYANAQRSPAYAHAPLLSKPVKFEDLTNKLRELLAPTVDI